MEDRTKVVRLAATMFAFALILGACKSGGGGPGTTGGEAKKGGTFRIEADEFPWELSGNGFDPVAEYVGTDWMVLTNLMVRPLMGYNHLTVSKGGDQVIPDLAEGPGVGSSDKKTWTYKLKQGTMFGRPISREITAEDIVYAFERAATPALDSGGYQGYYREFIEGFTDFEEKKSDSISGVKATDKYTVEFTLVKPSNDWDYRMAMPASAPVPKEAGRCFDEALEYGQYVVSSGPYEFEGMDKVDFSNCKGLKPPTGFDFDQHMLLIRNPNWEASKPDPVIREALPDRIEWRKNTNAKDIFANVEANKVDWSGASTPGEVLAKYTNTPSLKPFLKVGEAENATWYITLNLITAPFDDIHVRKAANLIMDKDGALRARGGPLTGKVAEHIVAPTLLGDLEIGEFDPYGPNHAGDLEKAKAEMRLSKYDTDKDGLCDHASCSTVRNVTRNTDPHPDIAEIIKASMAKIGITVTRTIEAAKYYGEAGVPSKDYEMASGGGWGPDWPEPLTFFEVPMAGRNIGEAGNVNTALLGLTKEQADDLGVDYPAEGVQSVDATIDKCGALPIGDERKACWVDLDKEIMNNMVPWIPLRWAESNDVISAAVVKYEYDQFASEISLAHVAVDPSKQVR